MRPLFFSCFLEQKKTINRFLSLEPYGNYCVFTDDLIESHDAFYGAVKSWVMMISFLLKVDNEMPELKWITASLIERHDAFYGAVKSRVMMISFLLRVANELPELNWVIGASFGYTASYTFLGYSAFGRLDDSSILWSTSALCVFSWSSSAHLFVSSCKLLPLYIPLQRLTFRLFLGLPWFSYTFWTVSISVDILPVAVGWKRCSLFSALAFFYHLLFLISC